MLLRVSALLCFLYTIVIIHSAGNNRAHAQNLDEVKLRLAWIPGFAGDQPPFYVGIVKGFYREAGIDLKILEGKGAAPNAALLASKSEQFSVIDANVLALSVGQGLAIRSIGTFVQQAPFDLIFRSDSGIRSLADLKGKTVGLQPGEAMTGLFSLLLSSNNVDPASVKVVSVTGANKPQLLYTKQIDAAGGYVTGEYYRVKLGAPTGMGIEQILYKDWGISTLNASVATYNDLINEDPQLVRRFMSATVRAWEYARAHPDEAVAATLESAPRANSDFLMQTMGWTFKLSQTPNSVGKPLGWTSEADWAATLDLLEKNVGLKNRQQAAAYFTNDFIP